MGWTLATRADRVNVRSFDSTVSPGLAPVRTPAEALAQRGAVRPNNIVESLEDLGENSPYGPPGI
jgi:hypothetical protein